MASAQAGQTPPKKDAGPTEEISLPAETRALFGRDQGGGRLTMASSIFFRQWYLWAESPYYSLTKFHNFYNERINKI